MQLQSLADCTISNPPPNCIETPLSLALSLGSIAAARVWRPPKCTQLTHPPPKKEGEKSAILYHHEYCYV